jgi:hypothetical protein
VVGCGSDWGPKNVFEHITLAVERPGREAAQAVTREEALATWTRDAARTRTTALRALPRCKDAVSDSTRGEALGLTVFREFSHHLVSPVRRRSPRRPRLACESFRDEGPWLALTGRGRLAMTYPRRARHAVTAAAICGVLSSVRLFAAAPPEEMKSAPLARQVSSAMTAARLDAIALQDPEEPGRFIAAMLIPDVQLLMVSARHSSPEYIAWQIGQKQYRDVYVLLQQGDGMQSRLFFQDLGVDGLPRSGEDRVDVMYERGAQTIFDAGQNGNSKDGYEKRVRDADARYSRLLQLAIETLRAPAPLAPVG